MEGRCRSRRPVPQCGDHGAARIRAWRVPDFAYPLPKLVSALREAFYRRLAAIANRWHEVMGIAERFPDRDAEFIARAANSRVASS